jgi:DNA mismatch endonuclease, patch repair protein
MSRVRQKGTKPELAVRKALRKLGYHYRLNVTGLPGSPDIVVSGARAVIFVHGCFWHRHPGCRLASIPKTNVTFWEEKFARNIERDRAALDELRVAGWTVITIWECETRTLDKLNAILGDNLPMRRHVP